MHFSCLSLPDPVGLLDWLVHDISLIFQNHLQLRWLLELLYDLLENISLLEENIPSIVVFSVFLSLVFCGTLAGLGPNACGLSYTAFSRTSKYDVCKKRCPDPNCRIIVTGDM